MKTIVKQEVSRYRAQIEFIQKLFRAGAALLVLVAGTTLSRAADGAWSSDADGNWSAAANWLNNIIADGPDSTAYFTNDITAIRTATLDTARTNGNLVFGDADALNTPGGWILSGSGLTLSSTATPVITVNDINAVTALADSTNDAAINSVITSPQGFIKNGPGTLTLRGANVLGSPAQLDEGIVGIGNASALGTGNLAVNFNGGGVRVWAGAPTYANTNNILTTGIIISSNGNYDNFNGPWFGSGTMLIHATGRLTPGGGNGAAFANFTGTIDLTDTTSGNETRINLGSGSTPYNMSTVTLNAGTNAGRFTFRTQVAPARVLIGALLGGPTSRLQSSEQAGGTSLFWEIGYLNTSTTFEGIINNRNSTAARVGHLVKVGTGKLTLTGSSPYTGMTIISNGVLALSGAAALTGATNYITVHSGGTFDVSGLTTAFGPTANQTLGGNGVITGDVAVVNGQIAPGTSSATGTLSCSNNVSIDGNSFLTTNLFKITTGANDQLFVAGDLTLSGTIALRLVSVGPVIPNGSYVLYRWGGTLTGDTNNFAIEYAAQPGTLLLSTNLVTKQIVLQVSGVPSADNLVWKGDGTLNAWDFTTLNWLNGVTPSLFDNGDKVTFDNTGFNNVPVDISSTVNPSAVIVNATQPYVISSTVAAGIIGSGGLTKSNTGTLTITTDNAYIGGTFIGGGILQVGDGSASSGTLGIGTITNNAVLVYNRPDAAAVDPAIVGTGSLIQQGSGTLSFNSPGSYTGGTTISNGTIRLVSYSGLGTGPVTLAGGTLQIVPAGSAVVGLANHVNVVANSTLQYDATGTFAAVMLGALTGNPGVTLTVNHSAGSPTVPDRLRLYGNFTNNANLDLTGSGIALAPYAGSGVQVYNGVISGVGQIVNRAGGATIYLNAQNTYSGGTTLTTSTLGLGADSTSSGGSVVSGPIGIGNLFLANESPGVGGNATVLASGGARTLENPIVYPNIVNFTFIIGGSSNLTFLGTYGLAGTDGNGGVSRAIQVNNTALTTFGGVIDDAGLVCGISKTGAGTLALNAINTYTGPTEVGGGTLLVNGQIDAGAVTVTNGALGGTGTILGAVTIQSPGSLSPGASIGSLTINNNLALNGNLLIEVNKSLAQSNDFTTVTGTLINGGTGTLTVSNLGPALAVGDKFILFNKAVQNGSALTVTGGGVTWNNNLATDGSITVAAIAPSQPPLITSTVLSGGNITISGTNGTQGAQFYVLSSTNLTLPRNSWTPVLTNNFGAGGSFSVNIPVSSEPSRFFLLQLP